MDQSQQPTTPIVNPALALLRSRKFLVALLACIHTIVANYYDVPAEVWVSIDALAGVVIAAIAYEDGQAKSAMQSIQAGTVNTVNKVEATTKPE